MRGAVPGDIHVSFFFSHFMGADKFSYTMGTAYIAAFLKSKGINTSAHTGCSKDLITFLEKIKSNKTKILGIPAYDPLFSKVRAIARETRRIIPDILIIAGGPTATFSDEIILDNIPEIDIAVRGESEETVFELVQYVEGNRNLDDIKGISFRDGDRIIKNEDRPLAGYGGKKGAELDVVPSPYGTGILSGLEPTVGIMTSRGCIFQCTFCCAPAMCGGKVRFHSIDRIIQELKIISENVGKTSKPHRIDFFDDNFCLNKKRTLELCEAIIKDGLNFNIHAGARADMLDRETLELMRGAGVRGLNFGLESAVPRVLRNIKKVSGKSADLKEEKKYVESMQRVVDDCNKIGITPTVNVIYGLPGETYEDGLETLDFIKNLNLKTYYYNHFTVFIGSEIYRDHKKFGMKVRHSGRILPVKHTGLYDISKITHLPNASPGTLEHFFIQTFENSLFEWWDMSKPFFKYFKPHIILKNHFEIDENIIKWLKYNLDNFSQIIFKFDEREATREEIKKIKNILRREVLSRSPLILQKLRNINAGCEHYRLKADYQGEIPTYCPSDYFAYPFDKPDNAGHKKSMKDVEFYTINYREDVRAFINEVSSSSIISNLVKGRMVQNDIMLGTSCRFMKSRCPASSLQKINIRKNHELALCDNAESIGTINDSIEDLKERITKISSEVEKERGCSSCPARNYCARCIYPAPFTESEYCEVVRSAPWLHKIIKLLSICHTAKLKNFIFKS